MIGRHNNMRGIHRACVILILLVTVAQVHAAIQPSFILHHSLQRATHIVLVTEGDVVDGNLEVIESWRGDLKPEARISIPELAEMTDEQLSKVKWYKGELVHEPYVHRVTGKRIVLFLIDKNKAKDLPDSVVPAGDWMPASYAGYGGFKTSAAWLENGEAYTFTQRANPGPSELHHTFAAVELKARVIGNNVIREEFDKAVAQSDPIRLVQVMAAYKHARDYEGVNACITSLGQMGDVALPSLRMLLANHTYRPTHPKIIKALVEAGGIDVAPDLTRLIKEQVVFWEAHAPDMEVGWWNNTQQKQEKQMQWYRCQYQLQLEALRALAPLYYEPAREVVTSCRDLWQNNEVLNEVGDGQIVDACNKLLDNLDMIATAE